MLENWISLLPPAGCGSLLYNDVVKPLFWLLFLGILIKHTSEKDKVCFKYKVVLIDMHSGRFGWKVAGPVTLGYSCPCCSLLYRGEYDGRIHSSNRCLCHSDITQTCLCSYFLILPMPTHLLPSFHYEINLSAGIPHSDVQKEKQILSTHTVLKYTLGVLPACVRCCFLSLLNP